MNDVTQLPKQAWPAVIVSLAEIVGDDAALILFVRFGGRHLRIPKTPTSNHIIVQAIGSEKTTKLCLAFGNEVITIPNGKAELIKARNQQIHKDRHDGMTQCNLATKYGLTERTINHILNTWALPGATARTAQ